MTTILEKTHSELAKSPDLFQDNNAIKKKFFFKTYTTTRIKSRNFLSNISFFGINKEEFQNRNFVFDFYTLLTRNLNPFSLDRKLNDQNKHEMIYMLWKECMQNDFYKYVCTGENFLYINGKNVLYLKAAEIIWKFIQADEKNFNKLQNNVCQFKNMFEYVYSNVYPEVYCSTERRGFDLRSNFTLFLKPIRPKKSLNNQVKILKITRLKEMNRLFLNRILWKLTCLKMKKKKKLKKELKKDRKHNKRQLKKNKALK